MPSIEILGTGRIDDRESAFPQAVQLPNGDILCSVLLGRGSPHGQGLEAATGRAPPTAARPGPWRAPSWHAPRRIDPHLRFRTLPEALTISPSCPASSSPARRRDGPRNILAPLHGGYACRPAGEAALCHQGRRRPCSFAVVVLPADGQGRQRLGAAAADLDWRAPR